MPDATWLQAVRQALAAVQASDITELELSSANFSVRVHREPSAASVAVPSESDIETSHFHQVQAPFTGIFYRAPTPSAKPYVEEGDWVDADAVIGLVETMKIFNEVTADLGGRIVRFEAESGQLVHAGDLLVFIEPGERATAEWEPRP